MNSYEIAEAFDISLPKARRIANAKLLPAGKKGDLSAAIRLDLSRNTQLSARRLLALLKEPGLIRKLNKYEDRARAQIVKLGNVMAESAPIDVTRRIPDAASGDRESVEIIMGWLKSVIPPRPVRFHWIAVRLLINQWPDLRSGDYQRVHLALQKVRNHPDFEGWWDFEPLGNQWPTIYQRPAMLFDL